MVPGFLNSHRATGPPLFRSMSRMQRSMLQLLASAVLLVVLYIVATPTDVPRSALLQPSAVVDSAAPKWLTQKEYRTAQLLLAQLDSGRHQQKQRSQEQLVRSSLAGVPSSSRAMRLQGLAAPDKNGPRRAAQHGSAEKNRHGGWYKCGKGLCYAPPSSPLSPPSTMHPLLLHRDKKHHRTKTGWYKCGKGLCWRGAPVPKLPADDDEEEGGEGGRGDDDGPVLPDQTTEADGREEDGEDEDGGEDEEDGDGLDLGECSLPNSDDSDYASIMQKIENGKMFCCPNEGQWKPIGEPCGDEEEKEHEEPTWEHDEDIWQQPAPSSYNKPEAAPSVSYNNAVASPHYYNNAPVTVNTPVTVNCPACTVHPHPCPAVCPSNPPAQNAPGAGAVEPAEEKFGLVEAAAKAAAERAKAEAVVAAAQKAAEETAAEAAAAADKAAAEAAALKKAEEDAAAAQAGLEAAHKVEEEAAAAEAALEAAQKAAEETAVEAAAAADKAEAGAAALKKAEEDAAETDAAAKVAEEAAAAADGGADAEHIGGPAPPPNYPPPPPGYPPHYYYPPPPPPPTIIINVGRSFSVPMPLELDQDAET